MTNNKIINQKNKFIDKKLSDNHQFFKSIAPNSKIITRSSIPMTKQWSNGVYNFNNNFIKNLPYTDIIVHKLIKNFFTAKPLAYNYKRKNTKLLLRRLFRLSLNRILVSKPEIKHFNDKVNITIFLYNKKRTSFMNKIVKNINKLSLNKNLKKSVVYKPFSSTLSSYVSFKKKTSINKNRALINIITERYLALKLKRRNILISNIKIFGNDKQNIFRSYLNNKSHPIFSLSNSINLTLTENLKFLDLVSKKQLKVIKVLLNIILRKIKVINRRNKIISLLELFKRNQNIKPNTFFNNKKLNNYDTQSKKNTASGIVLNTISSINFNSGYNIEKIFKNYAQNNNESIKNLSLLSNKLLLNTSKLIETFFMNNNTAAKNISLTLKNMLLKQKINNIDPKAENFIYFKELSSKVVKHKLICINIKGNKLTSVQKKKINSMILKSRKGKEVSYISPLYNKNNNFFNKLIVNNYIGYEPYYINKSIKHPTSRNNKEKVGGKVVEITKYKLKDKSLTKNLNKLSFQNIKRINKNIALLRKMNKINKFVRKYFYSLLNNSLKNNNTFYNSDYLLNAVKDSYKFRYLKDILVNETMHIHYIKMLSFNNTLYKSWFLTPLKNIISKIYNKQVVFNFINLKYLYLNSDLLTQAIVLKLKNLRRNRLNIVLRKVLNLTSVSKFNSYTQNAFNPTYNYIEQHYNKYKSLNSIIFKDEIVNTDKNANKDISTSYSLKWLNHIQTSTINFIKYKSVFGLKLEASGRLTKRSTASRAVFKLKYKGNLKNNFAMTRNKNPSLLKSNLIPNLQYSKLGSKTRNGSFGIKTWINNN